jgi:flagellar hook-length control protein FliK
MEWWYVALDIRSSSAEISSTGTKSSSSTKPGSKTFSLDLAASKPSLAASKTGSAAQIRSPKTVASPVGKNSSAVGKQSSTAKAASSTSKSSPAADADGANSADKSAAASKSAAAKSAKPAKTSSSANQSDGSSQDSSAVADAAAASNSTANNPSATGVAKGRAFARGAAAKANDSGTPDSAAPGDTDPSADASNASGLSLLQQLALALEGGDSAEPSTNTDTNASTNKAADGGNDVASNDANALALAMFAQAFAGALGISPVGAQAAASNSSPAASASSTSDRATGVSTGSSSSGGSMQQLVSLLVQDIAAGAQGKSDAGASRSDVATTLGPPGDTRTANATEALNSVTSSLAPSLAHLGAASHFSLHAQTGTNTAELKSSVGSTEWTDELGGQLTWMTQRGLESGSLRVSPEHLGPVEVKIAVQNGDASVWFGASHPDTRAALEQALPRLREMFANQGLTLTDSGVSRESPRQSRSTLPQSVAAVSAVGSSDVSVSATVRLSLGLVDTYA